MLSSPLLVSCLAVLAAAATSGAGAAPSSRALHAANSTKLHYSNHIFNAIHSSMRQWGSSLNHNGMSFFLATVPEGTQLYHGTHSPEPVKGTEWLAFEPEHAMLFAGPKRFGPPPGRDGRHRKPGRPGDGPHRPPEHRPRDEIQKPLRGHHDDEHEHPPHPPHPPHSGEAGWLHTYAARKDLRLLYIDGMSAAKSNKGVFDTQDRILFNDTLHGPGFLEYERAKKVCEIAQRDWDDRIDGVIRMEAGFEIILCSFARDLDVVRITRAKGGDVPPMPGPGMDKYPEDMFLYYKAITSRYHGIGGDRVRLNYDHFVTAFAYGLDLFHGGELPRLVNLSKESLEPIRRDLYNLVMTHDAREESFNWQGVVDMIVTRYANELKYLVSGELSTTKLLHAELDRFLRPFIDYDVRNMTREVERCATQFTPKHAPKNTLAAAVVHDVSSTICSTLFSALAEDDHGTAVAKIQELIDYLAWTTWKECQGCGYHAVCFIPIWPVGSYEDREHPRCRDELPRMDSGRYYWDDWMS